MEADLVAIVRDLSRAGSDFGAIWATMTPSAGEHVEIRHQPPSPEFDGWRSRADFFAYAEEEARIFPKAFESFQVAVSPRVDGETVIWDPLSLSGVPLGAGRRVDIRFRVIFTFESSRLVRVEGAPTPDTPKADIVAWLRAVAEVGGFHPPAPGAAPTPVGT